MLVLQLHLQELKEKPEYIFSAYLCNVCSFS